MLRLAAVQDHPVYLDLAATVEKAIALIAQASAEGADVIGFPEGFLPGHPGWIRTPATAGLARRLFENSVVVNGPEIAAIAAACREGGIAAVLGVCERMPGTTGTLFNTQVFIDEFGKVADKHQKYVPTDAERFVHAPGLTGTTNSMTAHGVCVTGLMCTENVNPLALYATSLAYPVVHVASWPQHLGVGLQLQRVLELTTRGVGFMLKSFVINSVTTISEEMIDAYSSEDNREFLKSDDAPGFSCILGPSGEILARATTLEPQVVYADVDPADVIMPKFTIDVAGHYSRPEIFAHLFDPERLLTRHAL